MIRLLGLQGVRPSHLSEDEAADQSSLKNGGSDVIRFKTANKMIKRDVDAYSAVSGRRQLLTDKADALQEQ